MLWQSYFIPGTGVLRNDLGITDAAALRDAEYAIAGRRLHQLERGEVQIPRTFDAAHLAAITRPSAAAPRTQPHSSPCSGAWSCPATAPRPRPRNTATKAGTQRLPPSSNPPQRPDKPHHDSAASGTTRYRHRSGHLPVVEDRAIGDNSCRSRRSPGGA